MGAMTPPSRKSCYNFRVTEINRVLDGDTIDVTIDLGFDLFKKERVRVAGVDTPEKRTRNLAEKALAIDATNWKFKIVWGGNQMVNENNENNKAGFAAQCRSLAVSGFVSNPGSGTEIYHVRRRSSRG